MDPTHTKDSAANKHHTTGSLLERIVAITIATWVIALVSYLILSDRSFDQARIFFLKILLSLSCGIVVATIPGFFNIRMNLPGIAVRAAGGAAAFVFVYTQSPAMPELGLAPPKLKVNQLRGVDFRSFYDPTTDREFDKKQMAITVPVEITNQRQPSMAGYLEKTNVEFSLGEKNFNFKWYYFVSHLPGPGTWLTSEPQIRSAKATALLPGQQFSEEIMHLSESSLQWRDFVATFKSMDNDLIVKLVITSSSGEFINECIIHPSMYISKIKSDERQLHRTVGRISTECSA